MAEENTPTVHQVGASFVSQYYKTLATQPLILYKFYKEVSHFTHGIEGEDPLVAHGQAEIKEKIQELDFKDCKVKLSVVDCQKSQEGSVVVVVQGYLSNCGSSPRRFTQTFILAVQPKGYYVFNDVFRYLSNDIPLSAYATTPTSETAEVNGSNNERYEVDSTSATVGTVDEPLTSAEEREYASDNEATEDEQRIEETQQKSEESAQVEEPVTKQNSKRKSHSKHRSARNNQEGNTEKDEEKDLEPKADTTNDGPRTFASIVAGPGYQPAPPKPAAKEDRKEKTSAKRVHRRDDSRDERKERKDGRQEGRSDRPKRPQSFPVFVKNVDKATSDSELRSALKTFGEVVNIENKAAEKGHASVYFRTHQAMKAALEAASVEINGIKVSVLKKRSMGYRGSRGRHGRPSKTYRKVESREQ